MDSEKIIYYIAAWAIGSTAGLIRAGYDGHDGSAWHLVCVAGVSGFLCFSIVALAQWQFGADGVDGVGYIGIGSLVALSGKEATRYISAINRMILKKLGIDPKEIKDDTDD